MSVGDMMTYYKAVVRPVLEYACAAWHPCRANHTPIGFIRNDTEERYENYTPGSYTNALTKTSMEIDTMLKYPYHEMNV